MRAAQISLAAGLAAVLTLSGPALAHEAPHQAPYGHGWQPYPQQGYGMHPEERDAWLDECRARLSEGGSVIEGALIGGAIGGLAGNRIAGRGNRTEGTIAGAAVGAVAGAAIDGATGRRDRDECEAYLDNYYAQASGVYGHHPGYGAYGPAHGYPQAYGYGHGYGAGCCGQPMMMVPIVRMARSEPRCTETVEIIEEYVDAAPAPTPPRARPLPRQTKPVQTKPIQTKPDKRVRTK